MNMSADNSNMTATSIPVMSNTGYSPSATKKATVTPNSCQPVFSYVSDKESIVLQSAKDWEQASTIFKNFAETSVSNQTERVMKLDFYYKLLKDAAANKLDCLFPLNPEVSLMFRQDQPWIKYIYSLKISRSPDNVNPEFPFKDKDEQEKIQKDALSVQKQLVRAKNIVINSYACKDQILSNALFNCNTNWCYDPCNPCPY
jgi:hypothetical protein